VTDAELWIVRSAGLLAAAACALLLQRLSPHRRLRGSWRVNGGLWLLDAIVTGTVCGICAFGAARWAAAARVGLLNRMDTGLVAIPVTVVLLDLVSYFWHRANHRTALLWRLHRVHHSDPTFTVSTGVRFHPGELLLSLPIRVAAVVLVGASVEAVLAFEIVFTFANLLEHGDIDLPAGLERRLALLGVTPALHRRHHTSTGPARDTNFGTIFSLWDRLFGTYAPSDSAARIETGLAGVADPTFLRALLLPLRRTATDDPSLP
jgi:sterol desaturase/sphingolipid hydroxylase (fatty acid hydroxylase superfamily)